MKEPKTSGKTGPMAKTTKTKKINQLVELIETGEFSKLSNIEMARYLKVHRNTLPSLLEEVRKKLGVPEVELIRLDLLSIFEKLKRRLIVLAGRLESINNDEKFIDSGVTDLELKIIREIRALVQDYVRILESFGIKEKVADKVDISADITQKKIEIVYNVPEVKQ